MSRPSPTASRRGPGIAATDLARTVFAGARPGGGAVVGFTLGEA
ncbi:hypothetical protein ACIG3E_31745 [Streptomyces sp. NPDC053474]